jgi:hypothetical protein
MNIINMCGEYREQTGSDESRDNGKHGCGASLIQAEIG